MWKSRKKTTYIKSESDRNRQSNIIIFDAVQNSHGIFGYNCALAERGVLGGDDFSSAAGAGAEEDKRNESKEKAGHFFDVGFWMLGFGLGGRF